MLPDKMAKLEAEIDALENQLSDPELYAKNHHAFEQVTRSLAHARAELHQAEEQWLDIELLRSKIEAAKKPA